MCIDVLSNRKLLQMLLRKRGSEVVTADDGVLALKAVEAKGDINYFDLILFELIKLFNFPRFYSNLFQFYFHLYFCFQKHVQKHSQQKVVQSMAVLECCIYLP